MDGPSSAEFAMGALRMLRARCAYLTAFSVSSKLLSAGLWAPARARAGG
jgi:hypothetical protein